VDKAEVTVADPVFDSNWDKLATPGFTELTALIKVHIGRDREL
jgi:hypothetical protein